VSDGKGKETTHEEVSRYEGGKVSLEGGKKKPRNCGPRLQSSSGAAKGEDTDSKTPDYENGGTQGGEMGPDPKVLSRTRKGTLWAERKRGRMK